MPTEISAAVLEVLCGDPALDPVDSALEALARYFLRAVPGLGASLRAFPEASVELDFADGPIVTVLYLDHQREDVATAPDPNDPHKRLWITGEILIEAQIDLWGDYRSRRETFSTRLEATLDNRLPWQEGLYLYSAQYHGRTVIASFESGRNVDEPEAAETGAWRRSWRAMLRSDLVRDLRLPLQETITLRPTVGADVDVTDPDTDLT